ncbi:hypothetical protein ACHAXN_004748 [Cyclotella atomus]
MATGDFKGATWLSSAFNVIEKSTHLNPDLYDVLRAFGKDDNDAPGPANLDPDTLDVDTGGIDTTTYLKDRIANDLLDEIDSDQAFMFSRRFVSVSTLLKEKASDSVTSKQLLRLALHRRAVQILSTTDPALSQRKALRIRALVDFIWSISLVLNLKDSPDNNQQCTFAELIREQGQQSSSHEFAPGFYHSTIEGTTSDFGPVHINILRINLTSSGCQMKCVDARDKTTDLPTFAKEMGAVAAISGGFFLYSEPDIELPSKRTDPVGLLISDGKVLGPPIFKRSAIVQTKRENGREIIGIEKIGMEGVTCHCSWNAGEDGEMGVELVIGSSLYYNNDEGVAHAICVHRADAEEAVIERSQCAFAIVGDQVVQRKFSPGFPVEIQVPLLGFVLIFPEEALLCESSGNGTKIMHDHNIEISVSYDLPSTMINAMAGGPLFFSDEDGCTAMDLASEDFKGSAPPVTFSQDETHDYNLLPRMGIGIAKCPISGDELLVCAAVDGRNLDRALGLTLQGTSDLLRSLGCYKAMNLDGGSSKRMVVWDPSLMKHRVVCLSTTEIKASNGTDKTAKPGTEPSRPVHSAILFCSDTFKPA